MYSQEMLILFCLLVCIMQLNTRVSVCGFLLFKIKCLALKVVFIELLMTSIGQRLFSFHKLTLLRANKWMKPNLRLQ